jgi:acetyl-CoA acetyltransferase family protein
MRNAVIVDAVRTPTGRRNGKLKGWHAVDLASEVLTALVERNGIDPARVDDVIMGCVSQTGEQGINVGRNALLAAGFPVEVPGVTIDRQCGSSQQAAHFAAQGIMAGVYDIVIAGGVETMTRVPMLVTAQQGPGMPFGPRMVQRFPDLVPQGLSAEMVAEEWSLSREDLDRLAYDSHMRAARATGEGRFDREIIPIEVVLDDGTTETMRVDEGIRPNTSLEVLATLKPAFRPDGVITAGNSSQISDGAAGLLIMGEDTAESLGLEPMVRFHAFAVTGVDPVIMLTAPITATARVLSRAGMTVDDIDLFEINEAFASVVGAWLAETGADWEAVNVNGGAMALGHPLGASGAKIMTTLVHEMVRSGKRWGLQSMCEGGGLGNATLFEAV